MTFPTIFQTCRPRADVLAGSVSEADFAADLAQVIAGRASEEYGDPARFFARTWPTRGANLDLIEHRVLRLLAQSGVRLGPSAGGESCGYPVPEDAALVLGLLFRTLAPMRNRANMRAVVEGIETMRHEEAAYWAGMAIHRSHPRRVLMALRPADRRGNGIVRRSMGAPATRPAVELTTEHDVEHPIQDRRSGSPTGVGGIRP